MPTVTGACHCRNIRVSLDLTFAPSAYHPRVCDCDFCRRQGAAYISDPQGAVSICILRPLEVLRQRQGSMTAEFLVCGSCAALIGVLYDSDGRYFATINARMLESPEAFGADTAVSPKTLPSDQKIERWKALWFSAVAIT